MTNNALQTMLAKYFQDENNLLFKQDKLKLFKTHQEFLWQWNSVRWGTKDHLKVYLSRYGFLYILPEMGIPFGIQDGATSTYQQ